MVDKVTDPLVIILWHNNDLGFLKYCGDKVTI